MPVRGGSRRAGVRSGNRFGNRVGPQADHAHAVGAELAVQGARERLHGGTGDCVAEDPWDSHARSRCGHGEDHAGALLDHVAHGIGVLVDGLLIEGVDLRRRGCASRRPDIVGDLFERGEGKSGKEDVCSPACEGAGDRGADCPCPAVDQGFLSSSSISVSLV